MKPLRRVLTATLLASMALPAVAQMQTAMDDVPAYNAQPPAPGAKLPPILKPEQLSPEANRYPIQARAYQIAAHIHRVLHQLPCYCRCDRGYGHNSLRSCFADEHGARCAMCMQELFYANQMLAQGKTAKQIRDGIMHGEASKIDLNKV